MCLLEDYPGFCHVLSDLAVVDWLLDSLIRRLRYSLEKIKEVGYLVK